MTPATMAAPFRTSLASRLKVALQALAELGPRPLTQYALYQLALRSGWLRRRTPGQQGEQVGPAALLPRTILPLPDRAPLAELLAGEAPRLQAQAAEIAEGQVRLFGSAPRPLELIPPSPLAHWTAYELGRTSWGREDVKLIWEPGRFGWACTLARTYHLTDEPRHARVFWENLERFLEANPPDLGPHWASGQEVALRLVCLAFAWHVFADSPETTPARRARLGQALADHAVRLPPTLSYARAQGNNHLLTEAAGLYTAGIMLPGHPQAEGWRTLGWRTFEKALVQQIDGEGGYVQHSTNYHRLMLQISLWVAALARAAGTPLAPLVQERLGAATRWLLALVDPQSGQVPNLGPNDGALILPLAVSPYEDFRPTLTAAARTFLGTNPFPPGPADEMALWLAPQASPRGEEHPPHPNLPPPPPPHVLRSPGSDSWAYLRATRFAGRPGHADQLHLDLWWRGVNVARDPGTYRYNGPPPWDNALAGTAHHNTITVDGRDQMTRAGRFLWLDWAQAEVSDLERDAEGRLTGLTARHDGFRDSGVIHQRRVTACPDGSWEVDDELLPTARPAALMRDVRLHWLLPDEPWTLEETTGGVRLLLNPAAGRLSLSVRAEPGSPSTRVQLIRSGVLLAGEGRVDPTQGWCSSTYDQLEPGLSLAVTVRARLPIRLHSRWTFVDGSGQVSA